MIYVATKWIGVYDERDIIVVVIVDFGRGFRVCVCSLAPPSELELCKLLCVSSGHYKT